MAQLTAEIEGIVSASALSFDWKIKNFSNFTTISIDTDVFSTGTFKWKLRMYPKGRGKVYDHLSLFLVPVDLIKPVKTEYSFAIVSQRDWKNTVRKDSKYDFRENSAGGMGWESFMPLSELHDPTKGYIVDDTCVISIEVACWKKEEYLTGDGLKDSKPKLSKIKDEA